MTSYRRINSRTINRDVQQQDNMVFFNKPLSQAIYPKYFSVPDASNNHLLVSTGSQYSATAAPNLTFDGTTLDVSANFQVDGISHVQQLDVSANLTISGITLCYGTIQAKQFLPGQIVNVMMLGYTQTDLSQNPVSITTSPRTKTLFSYSYTPKIATSYLLIEYQTVYTLNGGGDDTIEAYLYVINPNRIAATFQKWIGGTGGGTRSGTIFPIVGRYTNTDLTAKAISVDVFNNTDVDTVSVNADNSTWLKITEIGR